MSKLIDLTGNKYGMLTVVCREKNLSDGFTAWRCLCECGNTKIVRGANLKRGSTKSCGCLSQKLRHERAKHSMSGTRLYNIWGGIKSRCYRKNQPSYKSYGGRGIKMCTDWKDSFENFSKWALSNGYDESMTIERIDVNGDYCPENCKWIPLSEQARNRRSNILYEYNGETHCLTEWCERYNKDYYLVRNRIKKDKWSFERAMFEPVHSEKRNKKAGIRKR